MTRQKGSTLEPEALTVADVAALFQVSRRQVFRMLSAGQLPRPAKSGARPRWDRKVLAAWWAQKHETAGR